MWELSWHYPYDLVGSNAALMIVKKNLRIKFKKNIEIKKKGGRLLV
jgi:hypothetical protein